MKYGNLTWLGGSCADGLSDARISDEIAPALAFARLFESLGDGSKLTWEIASEADGVLVTLARDPAADALPQIFSRTEPGTYAASLVGAGGATLGVQFFLGANYVIAGSFGELIKPDLFRAPSYLIGAKPSVDGLEASVSYSSTGPLVELLGFGTQPPNPFKLDIFGADWEIGIQTLQASIVGHVPLSAEHEFDYRLQIRSRITDMLSDYADISLEQQSTSMPSFEVVSWDLSAKDDSSVIPRGKVVVNFGADLPLRAVMSFEDTSWLPWQPEIEIACR